ncbi:MAG TPA: hypothetical protein PK152_18065 [Anaerolineales bacterium]|nr:hypothetical protein [Anaerolineales bacterium]HRK91037.1 hypothetical protein [Anaerolineales bacterium]
MKNFREIEHLSAYLDGQLNQAESARLESRIKSDPELNSVLSDLRATRSLLRKLPARKAPRNFTLTRKMVGLKPPLPRTYPLFRLATTFAAVLFLLSFSVNALSPYFSFGAAAPAFGYGGGGGGDATAMEEAPAAEEPMMEMAPAEVMETPASDSGSEATEESMRNMEATPEAEIAPKDAQPEATAESQPQELQPQPEVQNEAPVPTLWVIAFLVIGVLSALVMWFMRQSAASKWR